MKIHANLHTHSCLSPCASLELSPRAIVERARAVGLNAVALTDHNTAANAPAFEHACRAAGIHPLFGLEVTTIEELHVLALFDGREDAMAFGDLIYGLLAPVPHRPGLMGDQPIVNERDEIIGTLGTFLGAAAAVTLTDLCARINEAGGLAIPSHVDRPAYSLSSQLGCVPDLPCLAVEVSPRYPWKKDPLKLHGRYACVISADAHTLDDLGRCWISWEAPHCSLDTLRAALRERRVTLYPPIDKL